EIMDFVLKLGGSITGEHGVGSEKIDLMPFMFTEDDLNTMVRLRNVFNPDSLLNPHKIIPETRMCREITGPLPKAKVEPVQESPVRPVSERQLRWPVSAQPLSGTTPLKLRKWKSMASVRQFRLRPHRQRRSPQCCACPTNVILWLPRAERSPASRSAEFPNALMCCCGLSVSTRSKITILAI